MQIDLFNEIQNPRPWTEGHEQLRFTEAIEQAVLADELGYGCWWQVEHHGAGEFSLSSAPEMMLAALSQRTSRIRLGHAAVLAPARFNNPIRVAERAATLDHLSGGRVELGMTRSTIPEWRLFGVDPDEVRAQTQEAFETVPRLWTSDEGVSISPKPLQRPHPPLWQAAASPASFEEAGRRGVGVLGTTMWESLERAGRLIELYRAAAERCVDPVGAFVNNQVAFFTFVHCADTDEEAMRNGAAAAAAWYTVTALTFFEAATEFVRQSARHEAIATAPDGGGLTGDFIRGESHNIPTEANLLIAKVLRGEPVPDDEIFTVLSAQDSLIVGSPETCRRKLRAYADLGIDRMMCLQQIGGIPHEKVLKSIRLIGDLIPDLA
ncbi:alkanesulfonate monooxygenase SsuD/methylene tetrahydromethanopterin reductase-like flavin-dependent oxidoreductase (luciferase family) [Actinokineospora baliensis]|uniref:LLM class flavin-dependent oxidoreductase n=1 Tax=Actinokineospora baliensis TaxID=547056 RepID=UPI0019563AFD|nr:LLM class flavin-dependent oxidoreductase [Actinokineospora baliensis]MBM7774337.1 alkanesulfonate monooxygenase SsuD/methylene tetrahydromethanopterin reductase-like flavin-dependent oxidoreductase (luciferase family) [Actinokineospora baliensis]